MLMLGYARLSGLERDADLAAQERELKAFGAARVFIDREGPFGPRPALDQCLSMLRHGDVFVTCRPDRLARKLIRFLKIAADLDKRGVAFVVLDIGGLVIDTRRHESRQQLGMIAGVVKWQGAVARERQAVGIARAKARGGAYKGRPPTISADLVREMAIGQGLRPARVAKLLGIARSSVYRLLPPGHKVTRTPKPEPRKRLNPAMVMALINDGMGETEIGRQLGFHRSSIRRVRLLQQATPPGRWS